MVQPPPKSDSTGKSTVSDVNSVGKEQFIEDTYFSLYLTCLKWFLFITIVVLHQTL